MDPLLRELRDKIDASGASVHLYAAAGGTTYMGLISKPSRFTKDFDVFIDEAVENLDPADPDQPTSEEFRALALSDADSEPDPRYVTLRNATVIFSAIESHRVPFLRLDLDSLDSWWIRPGRHPDDEKEKNGTEESGEADAVAD